MQGDPVHLFGTNNSQERREPDAFLAQKQKAEMTVQVTETAKLVARVEVTSGGLLSIAALVSTILLSTAVLVQISARQAR